MNTRLKSHKLLWQVPLACFILAGLTGFLYRLGLIGINLFGLSLENIRHAHSHLMFFGWAVPFPMFILMIRLISQKPSSKTGITWMKYSLSAALGFGILSYPFFLLFGYRPLEIGSASLPFAVILSGLVMIGWYGYAWGYLKVRDVLREDAAQPWFDASLLMLFVCSMGAWGVALLQAADPTNHLLMKGLTHFFLATFTEGWVVIVLIAILMTKPGFNSDDWPLPANIFLGCIALGAPLTFPYGISESLLSPLLLNIARVGGGITAIGVLGMLYNFYTSKNELRSFIWIWPVVLLALKAVIQLIASVVPSTFWLSDYALRIFYLHVLLLGAFSLAVIGWLHTRTIISNKYYHGVAISIFAVLFSLLLPTQFWPNAWSGIWIFYILAVSALLPVLAILVQWIKIINKRKSKVIQS